MSTGTCVHARFATWWRDLIASTSLSEETEAHIYKSVSKYRHPMMKLDCHNFFYDVAPTFKPVWSGSQFLIYWSRPRDLETIIACVVLVSCKWANVINVCF